MLGISKCLAMSEFQMFEPNTEIGAVNERTIKLLQTLSQHYSTGEPLVDVSANPPSFCLFDQLWPASRNMLVEILQ